MKRSNQLIKALIKAGVFLNESDFLQGCYGAEKEWYPGESLTD